VAEEASSGKAGEDPGGLKALDALVDQIQETAKWLITAFAAVAVLLVAGLSLNALGEVHGTRLVIALAAAIVGILAIAGAAFVVSLQLAPPDLTLGELISDETLSAYFKDNGALLQGKAKDLRALEHKLAEARRTLAEKEVALQELATQPRPDPGKLKTAEHLRDGAAVHVDVLNDVSASVSYLARFLAARERFLALQWWVAGLTVVGALAIAGYAIAANPPKESVGDFRDARVTDIDLSGTSLRGAKFDGAELDRVDFSGANVEDADMDGATFHGSTCPDGNLGASGQNGCAGHIYVPRRLQTASRSRAH
jgi:hypothetical protein